MATLVKPHRNAYRQLADKPTRGQSSRGLDNSWTGQLAGSELKKHGLTILYLYIKTNPNPNSNLSNIGNK